MTQVRHKLSTDLSRDNRNFDCKFTPEPSKKKAQLVRVAPLTLPMPVGKVSPSRV